MNKRMTKRMIIMLFSIGALFAGIIGYQMFVASMMKKFLSANALPSATVTAMEVTRETWQPQRSAVGTLRAVQGVDINSEVAGIVKKIHFKSGDRVDEGALLVELDAGEEMAKLDALKASRRLAEINLKRNREQLAVQAISQAQFDASQAELDRSKAEEAQQLAAIDKKRIHAPFSGRLGVSTLNLGQFINPAEKIVSLQNRETLYVDFKLPQKDLIGLKTGQAIYISSDTGVERRGNISAINAAIDPTTRNIALEGRIDNKDDALLPGMFVRVSVDTGAPEQQLTLPQTAISYNPYGSTLFVAHEEPAADGGKASLKAQQVFVKTGERRGDQIAILDGIQEGDMVVTSGQMKLKNGTPLIINNAVIPANEIAPRPQEM